MKSVKTPCIGVCSTVFGDVVCRGCKRFVHEVIDWNIYSIEQKLLVKQRLAELSAQVLQGKLVVFDKNLFEGLLTKVEVDLEQTQSMQIIEVLRKAAKQIENLADFGIQVLPEYQQYSVNELKELIDAEIHVLATATYQKNFQPYKRYKSSEASRV